ncbi:MAG: 3-dehydroquinate synthase [Clostridia bacterium]|nr:3-dehydroquinate synthase [Clostridia bacterium]
MTVTVPLGERSYEVIIEDGVLSRAGQHLDLNRKVLIVTDSGVPAAYAQAVAAQAKSPVIVTFPQGEESKNVHTWMTLLDALVEHNFTRTDCVVAVGGGVVGDMSGFAAAAYLRGIDFYNIPTTVLAQVDSSVGGKVAVDYKGYKNLVGAFHQPKKVLIDPQVLSTLPPRQISAGLAEAVKMGLLFDPALFSLFESDDYQDHIPEILFRSVSAKAEVVGQDETESGLRRSLNFGHTVGHGVETVSGYSLLHGECVALGMLPMCSPSVRARLLPVLLRLGLPTSYRGDTEAVIEAMGHDKKRAGGSITLVRCDAVGSLRFETVPFETLAQEMREVLA